MTERARSDIPDIQPLSLADLRTALQLGMRDFRRAPGWGLFFGGVYVGIGLVLILLGAGALAWTVMLCLGFPLIGPFAAVGLYEVSRRLEAGDALDRAGILGVVLAERHRQIPWAGAIMGFLILFWSFLAHMTFALFMGLSVMVNVSTSYEIYLTTNGLTMIAVELAVGAVFAFVLFALSVVSLPLLLDKELDFITAMLISLGCVRANWAVMLVWAMMVAGLLFLGMLPGLLGLLVVLPVLGHATWHLYRRALG